MALLQKSSQSTEYRLEPGEMISEHLQHLFLAAILLVALLCLCEKQLITEEWHCGKYTGVLQMVPVWPGQLSFTCLVDRSQCFEGLGHPG